MSVRFNLNLPLIVRLDTAYYTYLLVEYQPFILPYFIILSTISCVIGS